MSLKFEQDHVWWSYAPRIVKPLPSFALTIRSLQFLVFCFFVRTMQPTAHVFYYEKLTKTCFASTFIHYNSQEEVTEIITEEFNRDLHVNEPRTSSKFPLLFPKIPYFLPRPINLFPTKRLSAQIETLCSRTVYGDYNKTFLQETLLQ